jgi:acyl transferase domain-containing protein/thioesterase domain-containing protein/aryl carrier-like protein
MHPSLLDAASQATMALITGAADSDGQAALKPALPFALDQFDHYPTGAVPAWAWVRPGDGPKTGEGTPVNKPVLKYDIDLCDESGKVGVRMKGFTLRILKTDLDTDKLQPALPGAATTPPLTETLTLAPVWDAVPLVKGPLFPPQADRIVICGGTKEHRDVIYRLYPHTVSLDITANASVDKILNQLAAVAPIKHILWIAPDTALKSGAEEALILGQAEGVILIFRMIKALLRLGYETAALSWTVLTTQAQPIAENDLANPTQASIHGLIGSMAKEYPNWRVRLVDLPAKASTAEHWQLSDILVLPADPLGNAWVGRDGEWYRQKLVSCHCPPVGRTLYKRGGVYVVIGGAGGIGEVWSEYMIRTYQARIVWIGRRSKDEAIQSKIDRLAGLGVAPRYIKSDATDRDDLEAAYSEIKQLYGEIHGLIQAAIVLSDQSLANMDEERFRAGLAPKVDASVRLAQVFQKERLDFVIFFSSTTAFIKAAGQSNYAAGCAFKDAFAHRLAKEWPCAVKVMNWGYWGNVGIVASQAYRERMAKSGIGSIEPPEAMAALEQLLAGPLNQIALLKITDPLVGAELNIEERLEFYPEKLPSYPPELPQPNSKSDAQLELVKTKVSRYAGQIDELLSKLLWIQLQASGLFTEPDLTNLTINEAKVKAGLPETYQRWLTESLAVLARKNYLQYRGDDTYSVIAQTLELNGAWEEWERRKTVWMEDPNTKAQVVLVETTLRALPDILNGKAAATDIMFPRSSLELVEGVYKNNLVADYFNEILADTVAAYFEKRCQQDPAARIGILEIGAGTGGTSVKLFQKLKPYREHIEEYCYTDISKAFLMHAQEEYGPDNPYLTYKLFNVTEPLAGQGINPGGYDIVVAANVLHATGNIRQTLRNAKAAIAKNGLLLLNEICGNSLYTHLTFGLLEGWWLYEDAALRIPGCPGLAPESWKKVLESEGFRTVRFPARSARELGQQIIAAASDGIVFQKSERQPKAKTMAAPQSQFSPRQSAGISADLLRKRTTDYLKQTIGETLRISSHKIDSVEPLEKYGIDSILVVQLANNLGKVFANIGSALFFEYPTIDALAQYLMERQKAALLSLLGLEEREAEPVAAPDTPVDAEVVTEKSIAPLETAYPKFQRFRGSGPERRPETKSEPTEGSEIAIIGMAGRYPGAKDLQEFWSNLREGRDCITEIPEDRWDHSLYFDADMDKPGKTYCKWGGFLDAVDRFDPLFFNITPRDAELMDPMVRLFLETVWNLFENAGYTRETIGREYQSRVGVYVGAMYQQYQSFHSDPVRESVISTSSYSSIANRVSYYFNLQGPSVAVDTMCSASAVAIHMACESLIKGESRMAIAGGVNLTLHPKKYLGLSLARMLGSHSESRSFSAGDGFLPAEGVGAVLLKPLAQAVRDRDSILAVIKSTAINHSGRSNGYSVPNPNAQAQLIEDNFNKAGIAPRTISYVESAATGSALADSIEIAALNKAFSKLTDDRQFCAIGSVKSNIGHAEAASGISQLTKVVLQLQSQELVPSIKAEPLNPDINLANTPFYLQREVREWKRPVVELGGEKREYPRRATISSFGAGGSNAHLIVEEYIPGPRPAVRGSAAPAAQIVVFSAKNRDRLRVVIEQMLEFIEKHSELHLPDLAYTLQIGREALEYRLAMLVNTRQELIQGLKESLQMFAETKGSETTIPLYIGNQEAELSDLMKLLSGKMGETMLQMILAEKDLEKIALYWSQGGKVPWVVLHEGEEVRKIALPSYPFEKRRCWVDFQPEPGLEAGFPKPFANTAPISANPGNYQEKIMAIISNSLGMNAAELNINKPLAGYGADSIVLTSIFQQLQAQVDPSLTLDGLTDAGRTTRDIINQIEPHTVNQTMPSRQAAITLPTVWARFPELLHLNRSVQGRPVFWFHGALGGVEAYQALAQKIQRPFYGIQARGWMTGRSPLNGLAAIAAYYIHIIQSVQPEGPYDVGGYSQGGTVAYEIVRQLQELGETVNTIVMLDSMYCAEIKKSYSLKSLILQMVNIALAATVKQAPEKIVSTLIHRDEVDLKLDDETFLRQVLKLAKKRGLTKSLPQLLSQIRQSVKVRQAYNFNEFTVWPLPDPQAITGYYFRNKSGLFWGELEPYFTTASGEPSMDRVNYWEEWQRQLPNLNMIEVDSANHMSMLSDKSFEAIAAFCKKLYSRVE